MTACPLQLHPSGCWVSSLVDRRFIREKYLTQQQGLRPYVLR